MFSIPYNHGHFVLDPDASDCAVGGELGQIQNGKGITVGYGSAVMSSEQRSDVVRAAQILPTR